ncbi:MAG: hypothetical protein LM554_00840 [Desulfurococcaceae archaeon]|nr:hypothetical protein [Desulfurococcaceae archaeon]
MTSRASRRYTRPIYRVAVITLRALEILVVASLIILAVVAMAFFIRDLISLKPDSSII